MSDGLVFVRRIRRTPYSNRVEQAGVRGYSVYNHMILPKSFGMSVEEAYCCLLYTSPSPRDLSTSRMPSSA